MNVLTRLVVAGFMVATTTSSAFPSVASSPANRPFGFDCKQNYEGPGPGAFVGGNAGNYAPGTDSFIGAGVGNIACDTESAVAGGLNNNVTGNTQAQAQASFIGGGSANDISEAYSAIGAGENNASSANDTFIGAGQSNTASGAGAFVGAGSSNAARGEYSVVSGGSGNLATGYLSTIVGGYRNYASGQTSFAGGFGSYAVHTGAFVWSDSTSGAAHLVSTAPNQFLVRATGGVKFYSNAKMSVGAYLAPGSGTWGSASDRNLKRDVAALDDADILEKVAALPISRWSYVSERGVRHIGPMAQDFYAAFRVGEDDRHITSIDEDGVALVAVKALHGENVALRARNAAQDRRIARLESEVASLLAAARKRQHADSTAAN